MARRVFYSFHYLPDGWRASQVRNMGVIEGNRPVSDNDWEEIVGGGDARIEEWINDQMKGKSCVVVLIGAKAASRKWIGYEIKYGWNNKKGLLGIYVHNLLDADGKQSAKGANPFARFTIGSGSDARRLDTVVKAYDPPYTSSKYVYDHIKTNLATWVDEACDIRAAN